MGYMPSAAAMPQLWQVVGGQDRGGILVRVGRELSSAPPYPDARMSCGALLEEQELINSRLSYRRLSGTGPNTGWVSLFLKDKPLVVRCEAKDAAPLEDGTLSRPVNHTKPVGGSEVDSEPADAKAKNKANDLTTQEPECRSAEKSKQGEPAGESKPNGDVTLNAPEEAGGTGKHADKKVSSATPEEEEVKLRMVGGAGAALPLRLKRSLGNLEKPVKAVLGLRYEVERGRGITSMQTRLTDQELQLHKALEELRLTADKLDPPPEPPRRSQLRCASPGCSFLVHPRESLGGYCCAPCQARRGAAHGPRCHRIPAPSGSQQADSSKKPVAQDHLAEIELGEAVQLLKLHNDLVPHAVPDNTWLETNPNWSQSGKAAIGKWVSSIIDEDGNTPDTAGPKNLLEGVGWISRRNRTTNQWMVLDLGEERPVSEVRTRGHYISSGCNPRQMQWQTGKSLEGPWKTVLSFSGTPDSNWASGKMDPPVKSRWWRLHINSNGGSEFVFVWLQGFSLRFVRQPAETEEESGAATSTPEKDCTSKGDKESVATSKEDASKEKDASKGKEDGTAHKRWTQEDLRKNDEGWQRLAGYQKLTTYALLNDRALAYEEVPYIDSRWHNAADYARSFLSQNELMWREEGWSLDHDPNFFCELAYEGFNPIGSEIPFDDNVMIQVLSPCFEHKRSVLDCVRTHISRRTLKLAGQYTITLDKAYDSVMLGCVRQHGEAWLYRGVRWILRTLRGRGYTGRRDIRFATHSFELWDENGRLVAGDLGYTMGGVYVSQTGFHVEGTKGLGEVQLVLTSALLHKMGHAWFDMGQTKEYKSALGASTLDPSSWLGRFREVRDKPCKLEHTPVGSTELVEHLLQAIAASQERWPLRLLPRPNGLSRPALKADEHFKKVCVFGPYHSCTNALVRELPRFFDVTVVENESWKESGKIWKHHVLKSPPELGDDTLYICLVKDPAFWIQSLAREPTSPRSSTFYELLPVRTETLPTGETKLTVLKPKDTAQLFSQVAFRDELFPDALAVWEATVRNYFDDRLLPLERTAVVRCEDYLFSFSSVMEALVQRGLPLREDAPPGFEPLNETAKDPSHPELTRRHRSELLKYYADPAKRFAGLTKPQLVRLRRLDRALTEPLRYGDNAVASWCTAPCTISAASTATPEEHSKAESAFSSPDPSQVDVGVGAEQARESTQVEPCPQDGLTALTTKGADDDETQSTETCKVMPCPQDGLTAATA